MNTDILINDQIEAPSVRVVDHEGGQLGVMETRNALNEAQSRNLDLVLIAPNADPPVAKIVDWGREQYRAKKKAKESKVKQVVTETKEIQIRPVTTTHDLEIKLKQARKFIEKQNRVRFTMKFRGRESHYAEHGMETMNSIIGILNDIAIVDKEPSRQGQNIIMILVPTKK